MSKARLILIALIGASPAVLLAGGLIAQALLAGVAATGLLVTARNLRPGETEFLVSLTRPLAYAAAIPVLWVLVQILPLHLFVHPIWSSAAQALRRPLPGAISIDPGRSVIALGQYLSLTAVAFLSAAVAADRHRAEWILFAVACACTAIALILLVHGVFPGAWLSAFGRAQAIDCAGMGAIVAGAACVRTIERYERRQANPELWAASLQWTLGASGAALVVCAAAFLFDATYWTILALGCGLASFGCVLIIRRVLLATWGIVAISGIALGVLIFLVAVHPAERDRSVLLAFAAAPSHSLTSLSERVLEDAPLAGTGAGTFAALAQIYREIDDPPAAGAPATTAAAFAVELGKPMLWLILAAAVILVVVLLRAALRRGRDSFYSAMGGSCLIAMLLLAFANAGLLGAATGLLLACVLGLGLAQSRGRSAQTPKDGPNQYTAAV